MPPATDGARGGRNCVVLRTWSCGEHRRDAFARAARGPGEWAVVAGVAGGGGGCGGHLCDAFALAARVPGELPVVAGVAGVWRPGALPPRTRTPVVAPSPAG